MMIRTNIILFFKVSLNQAYMAILFKFLYL